ncbi:MAG: acetolactate decarboxylase, partial [Apilactobacillus sp.]|nr:acetolactate decarboxylase [Apilactobacillus sp.]
EKVSSKLDWNNVFYSVRAHGTFKSVKTRSVHKQSKPYPTLVECAHKQNEFEAEDVEGTVIGYFSPQIFNGAAVGGFHLHFLADDKSVGGHLLDFEMVSGDIKVQKLDELVQKLPSSNDDFMKHDFSNDDIAGAIGEAE